MELNKKERKFILNMLDGYIDATAGGTKEKEDLAKSITNKLKVGLKDTKGGG